MTLLEIYAMADMADSVATLTNGHRPEILFEAMYGTTGDARLDDALLNLERRVERGEQNAAASPEMVREWTAYCLSKLHPEEKAAFIMCLASVGLSYMQSTTKKRRGECGTNRQRRAEDRTGSPREAEGS